MAPTVDAVLLRAIASLSVLASTASTVEDEWQYVSDLVTVWSGTLRAVGATRAGQSAPPGAETAIDRLAAEAASISDPHRAMDWLSTLPLVALVAVGDAPR
ncbi:MAG TPA: hypothetical protein VM451_03845 [Candidatus Limnocylindria bacterium]|nr:hypothetical protein [Candidatus Limnocylindria bacterium]